MGDIGSTLVVGDAGIEISCIPGSNIELRGFEVGELGTDDGANSEGCSEKTDHRFEGIVETEFRAECDSIAGIDEP